jgi:hypothetical protein
MGKMDTREEEEASAQQAEAMVVSPPETLIIGDEGACASP